jgi:hypothetical protein
MTSRPSFRQIGTPLDVSDAALEKLNDDLRVPTLVKSPDRSPVSGQGVSQDKPRATPRPSPSRKAENEPRVKNSAVAGDPEPVPRLHVELPGYLHDAMRLYAAQHRSSLRHIILQGLAAMGFAIEAADLIPDGRRVARSGKKS